MEKLIASLLRRQDSRAEILAYSIREKFAAMARGTWEDYEFLHGCLWALFCMEQIDGDGFEAACAEAVDKIVKVKEG